MKAESIIKAHGGTLIDVRTPAEFNGGHILGSVNIPLQELPMKLDEIRQMKKPVVLCCASGSRSGQAMHWLMRRGIECLDGGSWMHLHKIL